MIEIAEFRKLKSNPIRFLEVATQLLKELDTTKEAVLAEVRRVGIADPVPAAQDDPCTAQLKREWKSEHPTAVPSRPAGSVSQRTIVAVKASTITPSTPMSASERRERAERWLQAVLSDGKLHKKQDVVRAGWPLGFDTQQTEKAFRSIGGQSQRVGVRALWWLKRRN